MDFDSAGDSFVQAFEKDSGVDSRVGIENVDFTYGFQCFFGVALESAYFFDVFFVVIVGGRT